MNYKFFPYLFCILSFVIFSCNSDERFFNNVIKPEDYNDRVSRVFIDTSDRMETKIETVHGQIIPLYPFGLANFIRVDDSISKPKGSLKYSIYRNGTLMKSFYPECCKTN